MSSNSNLTYLHVPWYNTAEWKTVYNQLFSVDTTPNDMKEALNTLIMWKTRMPRLYAAIEGTLIILKGFLEVDNDLPDDIIRQVLASTVMRFLNVCLTSNSKTQETFFHLAKSKNLPDWIVNIRHDFTHSQIVPSKEMLNRALKFLLSWLKEFYWDPQNNLMSDYISITTLCKEHIPFLELYEKVAEADEKDYGVTKLRRKLTKYNIRFHKSKYIILQRIADRIITDFPLNLFDIPDDMINRGVFLNSADVSNDGFIIRDVRFSWIPMILALSRCKVLLKLLKILVNICCKSNNVNTAKKSASWIKTICKEMSDHKLSGLFDKDDKVALSNFAYFTISQPNLYINDYIREMLILARMKEDFIFYTCKATEALIPKNNNGVLKEIYTVESLKGVLDKDLYEEIESGRGVENESWKIVQDTSIFDGLPLGKQPIIT